jgi:hypothetical protein
MLHEFLSKNRTELIDRCRAKVDERRTSRVNDPAQKFGIPQFLDQLIKTLQVEQTSEPMRSRKISGPEDGKPAVSEIAGTAAHHGSELLLQGFPVDQVVHDYGDLCQAITVWRSSKMHQSKLTSLKRLIVVWTTASLTP